MDGLTSWGFPAVFGPEMLITACSQPSPTPRLVELIGAEGINVFTPAPSLDSLFIIRHLLCKTSRCSRRSVGCQNQTDLLIPNLGFVCRRGSRGAGKGGLRGGGEGETLNEAADLRFSFFCCRQLFQFCRRYPPKERDQSKRENKYMLRDTALGWNYHLLRSPL